MTIFKFFNTHYKNEYINMNKHNIIIQSTNNNKRTNSRSKLKIKQNKIKRSTKTTLLAQNNQNDDFGLKSKSKLQKVLTQSTQQLQTLHLFKNTQIKKSIQITNQHKQFSNYSHKQLNNHSHKQLFYNQKKKSINKNLKQKSQSLTKNIYHKIQKAKAIKTKQIRCLSPKNKKNQKCKKSSTAKQQLRIQKLKSSCIKMLRQMQQEKQSQLQTLKIMHVLQEAEILAGQFFSKQQKKRLIKMHQIQRMIKNQQIGEVEVQIQQIIQQNQQSISNQYLNEASWV